MVGAKAPRGRRRLEVQDGLAEGPSPSQEAAAHHLGAAPAAASAGAPSQQREYRPVPPTPPVGAGGGSGVFAKLGVVFSSSFPGSLRGFHQGDPTNFEKVEKEQKGVPIVVQWKWIQLVSMRMRV